MSDPFIGQIQIFTGNFAPRGWAFCDGQTLTIAQNTALFALLGTTYGGNGRTTFALPDLRGRAPMHPGQGAGLSARVLGQSGGSPTVTLDVSSMPTHLHTIQADTDIANTSNPNQAYLARGGGRGSLLYEQNVLNLGPFSMLNPVGGSQPHNNLQPFLVLSFIIALQGIFPPRS